MPVWHERTRPWRESGRLAVLGIAQEQHPERCALYAQWQQLDWPILWDPLDLGGAKAVPNVYLLDPHGVVRAVGPKPEELEALLLALEPGGEAPPAAPPAVRRELAAGSPPASPEQAYAQLLWGPPEALDAAAQWLAARATPDAPAALLFRAGVALRLRHDSPRARLGDFQRALDLWSAALAREPDQYIWRRRLQQYGPRLDKPYPFYGWVARAEAEIAARGETPVELRAALTGAERADAAKTFEEGEAQVEPDPDGRVPRDAEGLLLVETAASFQTGATEGPPVARLHVELAPDPARDVRWSNEAEPLELWLDLPEGWRVDRRRLVHPQPEAEVSAERRLLDFELRPPPGARGAHRLRAYALFSACRGQDGVCTYLRRDLTIAVAIPEDPGER